MKRLAIAGLVLMMAGTPASAGMVLFDPASITITPGTPSVSFDTRAVPENLETFDTVSVIIGSLDGLRLSFQYDPGLFACLCIPPAPPGEIGIYKFLTGGTGTDIGLGGNKFSSPPWTNVILGILTVDTSTLVAGDVRQIIVSPELETQVLGSFASLLGSGATLEPLRGAVTITVVPEPATILSVAICFVAMIRLRRCGRKMATSVTHLHQH